ncbi:MAG: DMT family transporter [Clostridium sp.]
MNKYIFLLLAIVFEVLGTTSMKLSEGMSNIKYIILMGIFYVLSLSMLTLAVKTLAISVAYATWSGIGIAIITVISILLFKESVTFLKILFLLLIIIGTIGLNLTANHS